MDISVILIILKERLIMKSAARDVYLEAIIKSVIAELQDEKGLVLENTNYNHLMFCVDYAAWRYESHGSKDGLPRHLQYRLHNLILSNGRKKFEH